jgi:hypothetical protein
MLALANSPFLQLLLDNNPSPFPGGSFYCLQMLAFWLSWVRALYTGESPRGIHRPISPSTCPPAYLRSVVQLPTTGCFSRRVC